MRRPILLRLFLALGASRYARAYGFSSGNIQTDFYRRYDYQPLEEPEVESNSSGSPEHEEAPKLIANPSTSDIPTLSTTTDASSPCEEQTELSEPSNS